MSKNVAEMPPRSAAQTEEPTYIRFRMWKEVWRRLKKIKWR